MDKTMTTKISSQRHLDDEIVASKCAAKDYEVTLGKVIVVDGAEYQVVIDGNHSLAAARADGVEPVYRQATVIECDREGIEAVQQYLEAHWIDSDYYDVETGINVW
jgi:hypothetical protein